MSICPIALLRNRDGTSVVELALVLPVLLMLFAGLIDFGMGFSKLQATQQAAVRTVEWATASGADALTIDQMKGEAAAAAGVSVDQVIADIWLECDGTRMADTSLACAAGQESAIWTSVQIRNTYKPQLGKLLPNSLLKSDIPLMGSAKVRQQ